MKKCMKLIAIFALIAVAVLALALAGCIKAPPPATPTPLPTEPNVDVDALYATAVSLGFEGTLEEFVASLKGAKGDAGEKGDKGDTGTQADFLAWLQADGGAGGTNGRSAYDIFKTYYPDYPGTEEDWINDLMDGKLVRLTVTFAAEGHVDIVRRVFYGYDLTDIPEVPTVRVGDEYYLADWDVTDFSCITKDIAVTAVEKYSVFGFVGGASFSRPATAFVSELPYEYIAYLAFDEDTSRAMQLYRSTSATNFDGTAVGEKLMSTGKQGSLITKWSIPCDTAGTFYYYLDITATKDGREARGKSDMLTLCVVPVPTEFEG